VNFFIFVSQEWFLIAILIALLTLLVALMRKNNGIPISSSQLVGLMNQDKAILLDVRPAKDFDQGHIHGSINIPHNTLASRVNELEKHKESLIVIADQMGQHAGSAGGILNKEGFDIRRLAGGIAQWKHSNLPLVSGTNK
jgi:rhodanese-related sulfurtransferase